MLISECGLEESEAFTLERTMRGAERVCLWKSRSRSLILCV
jgi:hypothetical protein